MAEVLSRKPLHQESKEWQCPHCTAVNSHEDIDCRVCFKRKPGRSRLSSHLEEEQNRLPEEGPVKRSFVDNFRSMVLGKPAAWQCPRCTCEMGGYYNKCSACGFLRTDVRRKSDSSIVSDLISFFRQPRRGSQQQTTSIDPELDSGFQDSSGINTGWDCPQCTFRNNEKANKCHMCEMGKPKKDSRKKRKKQTVKTNGICDESFEMICDEDPIRVTPSLIDAFDDPPLEDENNLSLPQNPSSDTPPLVADRTTELVLPRSSCSPQHHIHLSLPSPPAQPLQPLPSTSTVLTNQTRLKPQTAVLSDPNTKSWKCSICGAFNLIFLPNQRCFVCGIGLIPNMPSDIEVANNKTQPHPGALVVHNHSTPRPQAGHGELVYTTQPNTITPMPLNSDHHHSSHVSDVPNGQIQQPQRPTRLTRREQGSGPGRRRRDSSIRRSAEEPLSTPGGNTTVLHKLEKHKYELEADRIYKEICQYCKKVREGGVKIIKHKKMI